MHWCEIEFDLPRFDIDVFQMNGKFRTRLLDDGTVIWWNLVGAESAVYRKVIRVVIIKDEISVFVLSTWTNWT